MSNIEINFEILNKTNSEKLYKSILLKVPQGLNWQDKLS